ncbi:type 4a pilus biogenesis protein PilO [Candidatus Woesebacteria bacterium]|nr:type 4a pilus biogenesis protein PilO [Candidatus Woesebacteria bacterium]
MFRKETLKQDFDTFVIPIVSFVVLIILSVVVTNVGYGKISEQKRKIDEMTKKESLLRQKVQTLQNIDANVISHTDDVVFAIPDFDSGPVVLAQIKTVAQERNITVDSLSVTQTSKEQSDIHKVNVRLSVSGEITNILEFVKSLQNIAPIYNVSSVTLGVGEATAGTVSTSVTADISGESYWAAFPKTISDSAQAGLTSEQNDILLKIAALRKPLLTQAPPSEPTDRTNPFGVK